MAMTSAVAVAVASLLLPLACLGSPLPLADFDSCVGNCFTTGLTCSCDFR